MEFLAKYFCIYLTIRVIIIPLKNIKKIKMRKIKTLLTLLVFASMTVFMTSCSNNNPEAVTKEFLSLIQDGKVKEAKELCDSQTQTILGMVEGMLAEAAKESKEKKADVKIVSSEIDGDKATVYYTQGEEGKQESMTLKKIDGKWKISIDKEGLNKEQ